MASVDFELDGFDPPAGLSVDFELGQILPVAPFIGFGVSKKVGKPTWENSHGYYGIWQMRMTKRGKRPIRMKFYRPTNPETGPQQANREKFADAMAAWMALTDEEREVYRKRARPLNLNGWNIFIREYFINN